MKALLALTGYYVGLGIEGAIILICAVLLVLMLTGVLFGQKKDNSKVEVVIVTNGDQPAEEEEEYVEEVYEEEPEPEEVVYEEPAEEEVAEEQPEPQPEPMQEVAAVDESGEPDIVYLQGDGVVFNDSKTITEQYEELTNEQRSFFDELREEALQKPDAELAIAKNFITVKIGKRNLIKLLIKRGVTVAEFMLENEALKQFRINNSNSKGKSRIKVKPTVVQVLDLPSLKVAVDMINLAYEELMMQD